MNYEDSICCIDAEQDLICSKEYFKRKYYPPKDFIYPPDMSYKHQEWWMYEDIPF